MAARVGLSAVLEDLRGRRASGCLVRLLTDSRATWHRLQASDGVVIGLAAREAVGALWQLAGEHRVQIVWVPGHAGIDGNEAADRAAAEAAEAPQVDVPVSMAALRSMLKEWVEERWAERYQEVCSETVQGRLSGGGQRLCTAGLSRREEVALFRLRLNRMEGLQAVEAAWGRVASDTCPHCGDGPEDAAHFLTSCPRWTVQRTQCLGPIPAESCVQEDPAAVVRFLRRCGLLQ